MVETTRAGKSDRIKAHTIAVEALGRGQNFDPQRDPIVRIEAVRLQQALTRSYAEEGYNDPRLIDVRRGSYVPTFRRLPRENLAEPVLDKASPSLSPGEAGRQPRGVAKWHEAQSPAKTVELQFGALQTEILATKEICDHSLALLCDVERICRQPLLGDGTTN